MDAKPMDKAAEDQLLSAVKEAVAWVEDGVDPTDAIVKVASALNLNPETTSLLVQAYNTGRTTFQRDKCAGDILCKMAEFPIARVEEVLGRLWPATPKVAAARDPNHVPDCFLRPPNDSPRDQVALREKVASAALPVVAEKHERPGDPNIKMAKAYGRAQRLQKQVEEARYQAKVARDRYLSAMGKLADYFKEAELFREKFAEVEYNSQLMFGPPAKYAMDYVYDRNSMREKRASDYRRFPARPIDVNQAPYSLIKAAIDRGREVLEAQQFHRKLASESETKIAENLRPFSMLPDASSSPIPFSVLGSDPFDSSQRSQLSFGKESSLLGNLVTGVTVAGASNLARGAPKPTEDLVSRSQSELADPNHQNALREIEAQTMLSDFLNNDEVLSGFDPDEVLQAYNEVVQLSPHAATQPAVMRPLLRKRLSQGSYEPFEAQQIADIEKSVAQSHRDVGGIKLSEVLHGSSIFD